MQHMSGAKPNVGLKQSVFVISPHHYYCRLQAVVALSIAMVGVSTSQRVQQLLFPQYIIHNCVITLTIEGNPP